MVLEASASNTRDATFKVPVARLRSLRDQIQALFGLPDTNALCEWTHLYEDVSEVLTAVEVKLCAASGSRRRGSANSSAEKPFECGHAMAAVLAALGR